MLYVGEVGRRLSLIPLLLLFSAHTWAAGPVGGAIQGTLYSPGGGPVISSNVTFKVQVLDKSATCVLYEEVHSGLDLSGTNGDFSFNLGSGSSKVNNVDASSALKANIFRNDVNIASSASCPGGVTVAAGDERLLRVMYDVAGGTSYSTLSPDMKALGAPYSVVAETLQGKSTSDFVQILNDGTHVLTQANVENVFSTTNYPKLQNLLAGTASVDFNNQKLINVANPTSAQDAATKNYSDTNFGGKTLDLTGVGAASGDKFVMSWDQAAQKWVAGLANDTTKLPLAGGTMTGAIAMGAQNITNIGHMTMAAQRTIGIGSFTDAQETSLIATPLAAADAGKFWYNSDHGVIKVWNGGAAVAQAYTNGSGQLTAAQLPASAVLDGGNAATAAMSIGNNGNFSLNFRTNNANVMTIDNAGKVGIGSSSPAVALDVVGSATLSSNLTVNGGGITGGATGLTINSSAAANQNLNLKPTGTGVLSVLGSGGYGAGVYSLESTLNTDHYLNFGEGGLGNVRQQFSTYGIVQPSGSYYGFATGGVNHVGSAPDVTITRDAAGQLASRNGTNAQQYNLYNTYTNASNYERAELNWQSNANVFTIQTKALGTGTVRDIAIIGGKVGIGTTAPTAGTALDVYASGTNSSMVVPRETTGNRPASGVNGMLRYNSSTDRFEGYEGGAWVNMSAAGSGAGDFMKNGSVAMTAGLHLIDGAAGTPSLYFDTAQTTGIYKQGAAGIGFTLGGSGRMSMDASNFYGSVTGAPSMKLDSSNDAGSPSYGFYGDTGLGVYRAAAGVLGFATGTNERMRLDSSGNLGIGTTTANYKLDVNGPVNSTSFKISGVNGLSMPGSDTNIAIGKTALNSVTTGTGLIAIGNNALPAMTTFTDAIAIGNSALASFNANNQGNIALGHSAEMYLTGGYRNIALGGGSIGGCAGGNDNVAVGSSAGGCGFGLASSNNVSVGNSSAGAFNGAQYNVLLGTYAGNKITTGNRNIILGAGPTFAAGLTTGSDNILIGYDLQTLSATGSNQLSLGNLIFATGLSNGATMSTGRVGIGTVTPTAGTTLDITGTSAANSSMIIPRNTTANRPGTGVNGMMRYNSTIDQFEGYAGGAWVSFASTGGTSSGQSASGALTYTSNSDSTGSDGGFTFQSGASNLLTINNAGDTAITSTTISTSSTTGALIVSGGLGVAAQINAGGTITGTALVASKADATPYTATGGTDTPAGATTSVANSSNTDGTGAFAIMRARNANGNLQNAYIGTVSTTGAGSFTPSMVIGQQSGSGTYAERMRFDSSGNVGIGTAAPGTKLDVFGALNSAVFNLNLTDSQALATDNGGGIAFSGIYDGSGNIKEYAAIRGGKDSPTSGAYAGHLSLYTRPGGSALAERMRILSTGNVGIGSTAPTAALDVNGAINIKGVTGINYISTDSTANGSIAIGASALAQQSSLASAAYGNTAIGYQSMSGAGMTTAAVANVAIGYQTMTGTMGSNQNTVVGYQALKNDTSTSNYNVVVGYQAMMNAYNSTWMTAVGAGALKNGSNKAYSTAIGTEAVGGPGGGGFYTTAVGHRSGYNINHAVIANSLFGSSSGTNISTGQYNTILGYNTAATLTTGSSNIILGNGSDVPSSSTANFLNIGNLIFATGMTGTLAAPAGMVGIGTTVPTQQLDVVGYIRTRSGIVFPDGTIQTTNGSAGMGMTSATDVNFAADTDADTSGTISMSTGGVTRMTITNGGNIGIGSASPASALDVAGAISVNGVNAINYPSNDTTVNGTVAIGPQALSSLSGSFAVSSTAVGYQALKSLTTGYQATAVGYQALMSQTTNYTGTALGYQAARLFTTASQPYASPTAIGAQALSALTTGGWNTAVGRQALVNLTTGTTNVAVGDAAAQGKNSTSSGNTAIGYATLYAATSSASNNNTAIGNSAIYDNTTGSNNTALGALAGRNITTGSENIMIGYYPTNSVGITTGANNILIGYDVRPVSQTGNNQLNIGNLIYGAGLGSGTTAASGGVGIGTNAPTSGAILDVNGTGTTQSAMLVPRDTTANRPTGVAGMFRYNTTLGNLEWFNGTAWTNSPSLNSPTFSTNLSISGSTATPYVSTDGSNAMPVAANSGLNMNNSATVDGTGSFIKFGAGNTAVTSQKALIGAISETSGNTPSLVFGQQSGASTYAERMRIDASGRIGIGTTAPSSLLHAYSSTSSLTTPVARIDTNTVGIGDSALMAFNGRAIMGYDGGRMALMFSDSLGATGNKQFVVDLGGAERFRISNSGNVGIGTNNPSFTLDVNGNARATGSVASWSDIRAKKNISEIPEALKKVQQLRGVTFDWRRDEFPDKKFKETRDMGVIAQDVEKVFPEAVQTAPDGYKSVAYTALVAPLIQAIKELYAQWFNDSAELHREIDQLKLQNAELMKRLEALERNQRAPASAQ